jgi:hypothetical protein
MDHLSALELNLSNERIRFANAKTNEERELRKVWVMQLESEVSAERKFIGCETSAYDIDADDLLGQLGAA